MRDRIFIALIGVFCVASARAQVIVSGTYNQNFDTLASTSGAHTWSQNQTLSGWSAYYYPSNPGGTWLSMPTYRANNGSEAIATLYSYGAVGGSDRGLGSLAALASGNIRYGVGFTNGFANSISSLSISYKGETWRAAPGTLAQHVDFQYSLNATSVNDLNANWLDVDSLDMSNAAIGNPSVDGNLNFQSLNSVISNLSIGVGQTVWIRWNDIDSPNTADHGLAVDDLTVEFGTSDPVPEPGTMSLMVLAAAGFVRRRLRAKK